MLLTRDQFRQQVFERDHNKCVFCDRRAIDAHHIIERRLWSDGGYYLNNGASVCTEHHLQCESTELSVEQVRAAAKITKPIIPDHLYDDQIYDKWANIILPNGTRLRGELFEDASVQKILSPVLHLFSDKVKYPRTHHLPWSGNINSDDRVLPSTEQFINNEVVVTEKMDGENTTLYREGFHARSVTSSHHESQSWVKQFHSQFAHEIPEKWRICGENLYAVHSIPYSNLKSYFLGFSIWDQNNQCLSWDDTTEWFTLLGIIPVDILYRGIYNQQVIQNLIPKHDLSFREGYVVRIADSFSYRDFKNVVGKYVRPNHIQTVKHWKYGQRLEVNLLQENNGQ